jgi:hypothetical protein
VWHALVHFRSNNRGIPDELHRLEQRRTGEASPA